jgi:hypothetical protein
LSMTADEMLAAFDEHVPKGDEPQEAPPEQPQEVAGVDPAQPQEPVLDGRLRDPDTGQFTTEEALQRKYAGRFDSPEELEENFLDLNSKVGSMANELGQWRAYWEQQQAQQQQSQFVPADEDELYEYESPQLHQAAESARYANNPQAYEKVMDAWYANDAKSAARYEQALAIEAVNQNWQQQIAPALQPLHQQYQQQQFNAAYLGARQQYQDFEQVMGSPSVDAVGKSYPWIVDQLKNAQTVEEKFSAIDAIYHLARGLNAGQPQQPQQFTQPTGPTQVNPAAAHVASPTSIPQGGQRTTADAFLDAFDRGLENG